MEYLGGNPERKAPAEAGVNKLMFRSSQANAGPQTVRRSRYPRRRLTMPVVPPSSRKRLDAIAWKTIHEQGSRDYPPPGVTASGRPSNFAEYAELAERWDPELAWSEFLHEFYRYKQASFLAVPPPKSLPRNRALLAGVAEFLSQEFGLPVPT